MAFDNIDAIYFGDAAIADRRLVFKLVFSFVLDPAFSVDLYHRPVLAKPQTVCLFYFQNIIELCFLDGFAQEREHVLRIAS